MGAKEGFTQTLPYEEMFRRCAGCQHALATPEDQLPQAEPSPDQASGAWCRVKVVPYIKQNGSGLSRDGKAYIPRWEVTYTALAKECALTPNPSQEACSIARAAAQLVVLAPWEHTYLISKEDMASGRVNFDPLQGPIIVEPAAG